MSKGKSAIMHWGNGVKTYVWQVKLCSLTYAIPERIRDSIIYMYSTLYVSTGFTLLYFSF